MEGTVPPPDYSAPCVPRQTPRNRGREALEGVSHPELATPGRGGMMREADKVQDPETRWRRASSCSLEPVVGGELVSRLLQTPSSRSAGH